MVVADALLPVWPQTEEALKLSFSLPKLEVHSVHLRLLFARQRLASFLDWQRELQCCPICLFVAFALQNLLNQIS